MRMLLTSGGIQNPTIRRALDDLLPKPLDECRALCVPTALYGHPHVGPGENAWRFVSGREDNVMTQLEWSTMGLLELTALPSIPAERWQPLVQDTDVLLVGGGDALYLAHWIRESGLAAMLPRLDHVVWVGLSAGSMVMTPRIGDDFVGWRPPGGGDEALGLVDFCIYPHLDHPSLPHNTTANARQWASTIGHPAFAIDDDTAICVVDDEVDVVSEGRWLRF
jgi:dipeptidase E